MKRFSVISSFVGVHISTDVRYASIVCYIVLFDHFTRGEEKIKTSRRVSSNYAFEYCKKHHIKLEVKDGGMLVGYKG